MFLSRGILRCVNHHRFSVIKVKNLRHLKHYESLPKLSRFENKISTVPPTTSPFAILQHLSSAIIFQTISATRKQQASPQIARGTLSPQRPYGITARVHAGKARNPCSSKQAHTIRSIPPPIRTQIPYKSHRKGPHSTDLATQSRHRSGGVDQPLIKRLSETSHCVSSAPALHKAKGG